MKQGVIWLCFLICLFMIASGFGHFHIYIWPFCVSYGKWFLNSFFFPLNSLKRKLSMERVLELEQARASFPQDSYGLCGQIHRARRNQQQRINNKWLEMERENETWDTSRHLWRYPKRQRSFWVLGTFRESSSFKQHLGLIASLKSLCQGSTKPCRFSMRSMMLDAQVRQSSLLLRPTEDPQDQIHLVTCFYKIC